MKRTVRWKPLFAISLIGLFLMLFSVLYFDLVKLPESGFSRGIEMTNYQITGDFEDYYAQNAFVVPEQNGFSYIYSDLSSLHFSRFDMSGVLLETKPIELEKSLLQLNGQISADGQSLHLFYQSKEDFGLYEADFLIQTGEEIGSTVQLCESPRAAHVGEDHVFYATDTAVFLYKDGKTVKIADAAFVETMTSFSSDKTLSLSYTFFDKSYYKQMFVTTDAELNITTVLNLYNFIGSSSTLPKEMALFVDQGHFFATTVFKDTKTGGNFIYVFDGELSDGQNFETRSFSTNNYSLFPKFYKQNDQVMIAYSFPTAIGRVDIETSGGSFTNLVTSPSSVLEFKALTKSVNPSIKPLFFSINNDVSTSPYQYLIYTEIDKKKAAVFISSNDPVMVEKSKSVTSTELLNLIMTTLTTFLPLSYLGLILEVYILVPILILVLMASMFYITWAEKNGEKLLKISIALHIVAKFFFVYSKILSAPEKFVNFPFFLDTPIKLFGWGLLFTGISLLCFLDYKKRDRGVHYLKAFFFFNVIDLILFVMLYTPYLFIS